MDKDKQLKKLIRNISNEIEDRTMENKIEKYKSNLKNIKDALMQYLEEGTNE